jgi:hypothetical protein
MTTERIIYEDMNGHSELLDKLREAARQNNPSICEDDCPFPDFAEHLCKQYADLISINREKLAEKDMERCLEILDRDMSDMDYRDFREHIREYDSKNPGRHYIVLSAPQTWTGVHVGVPYICDSLNDCIKNIFDFRGDRVSKIYDSDGVFQAILAHHDGRNRYVVKALKQTSIVIDNAALSDLGKIGDEVEIDNDYVEILGDPKTDCDFDAFLNTYCEDLYFADQIFGAIVTPNVA